MRYHHDRTYVQTSAHLTRRFGMSTNSSKGRNINDAKNVGVTNRNYISLKIRSHSVTPLHNTDCATQLFVAEWNFHQAPSTY